MTVTDTTATVTDVAPATAKVGGLSFPDYVQIISGAKELPESEMNALEIVAQIMSASSLQEGLGEKGAQGLRNHIGEHFLINDFHLNRSDDQYAAGGPVYAAIDATMCETGEKVVLTTGSLNVLAGLGLVLKLNQWGERFTTREVDTKAGKAIRLIYVPPVQTVPAGPGGPAF